MNEMLKVTVNLVLICAAAGLLISSIWARTEPVKLRKEAEERELALKGLVPAAESISPARDVVIADRGNVIYRAVSGGEAIGYVVSSVGRGYSSYIRMLVAVDLENVVTGIEILGHGETPGLGDQIMEEEFKGRFAGKALDNLVVVKGETDTDIQAISGATISSKAVTKGVRAAVETLVAERSEGLDEEPLDEPAAATGNQAEQGQAGQD